MLKEKDLHCDWLSFEKSTKRTNKKYKLIYISIDELGCFYFTTFSEIFYKDKKDWFEIKPDSWVFINSEKCFSNLYSLCSYINIHNLKYIPKNELNIKLNDPKNKFPYVTTITHSTFEEIRSKEHLAGSKTSVADLVDEKQITKQILHSLKDI